MGPGRKDGGVVNESIRYTTRLAQRWNKKGGGNGDDDGSDDKRHKVQFIVDPSPLAAFPSSIGRLTLRLFLAATVTLYVLNQKHLLPKPLSSVVSRVLFWPTLPITVVRRIGEWATPIDDAVVLGGAPFGFIGYPQRLRDEYGVRNMVNLCDEFRGPTSTYKRLEMRELWLRTVDHFEPSVVDLKRAVSFIEAAERRGERTYVHCRAGHGRSAAVVFAWLLHKNPAADPERLNAWLVGKRDVRKKLWQQPNIREYHTWLRWTGGHDGWDSDDDTTFSDGRSTSDGDGNEY